MARTLNPVTHAVRRDAFVDVAQRLIQAKGYEAFSIQDVIDEVGASKGAFYHYFGSKGDLLEAIVERMADAVDGRRSAAVAVAGPSGAASKLEGVFADTASTRPPDGPHAGAAPRPGCRDQNTVVREQAPASWSRAG